MKTTFLEQLRKLINQHGSNVEIANSAGGRRQVGDAAPETWELAKDADRFRLEGRWHERTAFETLVAKRLKPGNAIQIA
jgi:hypothetical protein